MFLGGNGLLLGSPVPDADHPGQREAEQPKQLRETGRLGHARLFEIQAAHFHGREGAFDLSALSVGGQGLPEGQVRSD